MGRVGPPRTVVTGELRAPRITHHRRVWVPRGSSSVRAGWTIGDGVAIRSRRLWPTWSRRIPCSYGLASFWRSTTPCGAANADPPRRFLRLEEPEPKPFGLWRPLSSAGTACTQLQPGGSCRTWLPFDAHAQLHLLDQIRRLALLVRENARTNQNAFRRIRVSVDSHPPTNGPLGFFRSPATRCTPVRLLPTALRVSFTFRS